MAKRLKGKCINYGNCSLADIEGIEGIIEVLDWTTPPPRCPECHMDLKPTEDEDPGNKVLTPRRLIPAIILLGLVLLGSVILWPDKVDSDPGTLTSPTDNGKDETNSASSSSPLLAQDLQAGLEAYNAGNYATALKALRPLAEQGFVRAQYKLGLLYNNGKGVTEDHAEAARWYRKAAEQGHAGAQNNLARLKEHERNVIVDGSDDKTLLRIWDAQTGAQIGAPLTGHEGWVLSVAFSPDGRRIVSGSRDKTLRIWDAQTGAQIGAPLTGHEGWVRSVAFSPDGRRIVSGSDDKTLRIWDAQTGEKAVGDN